MIQLCREIRFSLVRPPESGEGRVGNSWSGWPVSNSIAPFLVLKCAVMGQPNSQTGYVCNIKELDHLLRGIVLKHLVPMYEQSVADQELDRFTPERMIRTVHRQAQSDWESHARIDHVQLCLSPFVSYTIYAKDSRMIQMTQQFEFSAAHRLHCDELSDEENRNLFGKCNNLQGHGHNYVFEVTVGDSIDSDAAGTVVSMHDFEFTVKRLIVDRLDHKHLNLDVDHFKSTIPTVENIAIAIWNWLDQKIEGATLKRIRVFETPKTWAEYSGPET